MRRPLLAHALAVISVAGIVLSLVASGAAANTITWGLPILVFTAITLTVGWLLAWRRPDMALGWLLLLIALLFGLQGLAGFAGSELAHTAPAAATWLLWWGGDNQWSWLPPLILLVTQVPLRFPTGRLPSSGWRWFSRSAILLGALACLEAMTQGREVGRGLPNPTYIDFGDATGVLDLLGFAVLVPAFVGSVASLVVRYRHARVVERTQLRWVFWAATVATSILVLGSIAAAVIGPSGDDGLPNPVALTLQYAIGFGYSLIPLAILFAVLRRGLYSIDRIISRTAAYAIVTLGTLAVYGGALLLVSLLFSGLPAIGVAIATLTAAAVFLPLLRLVRRVIDRRFDRAQYDAQTVVEHFGRRVRNGADPHTAGADLLGAVSQTLQPTALGLWTREDPR
ncbi:hypothetical protein [Amnibacterium sp.]|uniref:hypothetical protein n=1 Tax=Amnibacterium sp. TaxID=1872496 RepID=UPI002619A1BD|nr:hypothetical protein [Amnibacterium sp.]MCU1472884.1 integral rane sensor signal transduction histidine kinase [Amnibacterium sp.]